MSMDALATLAMIFFSVGANLDLREEISIAAFDVGVPGPVQPLPVVARGFEVQPVLVARCCLVGSTSGTAG